MRSLPLLLLLALGLPSPVSAAEAKLNVFIWSEYLDPQVVKEFEHKFSCKVTVDVYEDAESMLAKLQAGGAALYDLVVPPDHLVPTMVKLGLLAPLRPDNLPNLKNLDAKFASPPYDRGNKFSVAYQWGTVGILVRAAAGKPVAESWGLVFDERQQPGKFVLIDSVRDCLGAALKFEGHSLNSTEIPHLKEARNLVIEAKRRAAGFDGSVGAKNKVLAKSVTAAIVYSGEAARAMADDTALRYIIPREGSQIWVDNLCIPAKAPHRDLAEKFINYVLDAKVGARLSNFLQFAMPNAAAKEFIKREDLKNPAIYPPADVMAKLEFLEDLGAKTKLFDEAWTQVKAR
ncbi:MAG: spermidine/putrescine ABC transporter substrate-binding protein [Verrucomicrobia bacterium]|nr:spermidine/putrescine ABC transporter substrate-binding protein [Verrucomicrobiota bacterium]